MNLLKYVVRMFCSHKRERLIHTYWDDDGEDFVSIETFECLDCGKQRQVSSGVLRERGGHVIINQKKTK